MNKTVPRPVKQMPLSILLLLCILFLNSCDNGSSTAGGSGGQALPAELVGPNLNGNNWAGHFKSIKGKYTAVTAVIHHAGDRVTIKTSIQSGVASSLEGTIDKKGRMTMVDTFDSQTWTTRYRPASGGSITLADFVFRDNTKADTNILSLKR